MTDIPKQLRKPEFRFCRIPRGEKGPKEKDWQKNGYTFHQVELVAHLQEDGNFGIIGGYGGLLDVACDSPELEEAAKTLDPTFAWHGAKPYCHYLFRIPEHQIRTMHLKINGKDAGDLLAWGGQGVGPGSLHPSGVRYEVVNDEPIREITEEQLRAALKNFMPKGAASQKILVEPASEPQSIPFWMADLLKNGVDEGRRNVERYKIIKELHARGYPPDAIESMVLTFNSRCHPPKEEHIVQNHVKYLLEHADLYLKRELDLVELEKLRYGEPVATAERRPPKLLWASDLESIQVEPPKWLVEGLISEKSINMLAGKRSTFKSWMALNMGLAIASGKPFLDKFGTVQENCLYIDEENGAAVLNDRVRWLRNGLSVAPDVRLGFLCYENIKLDKPEYMKQLEAIIQEHGIKVIFVDSLRRTISMDENEAGEISKLFTDIFRPISEKFGVSWILLHHLRKGISGRQPLDAMDELRGSSELTNYADGVIILERPRSSNERFILRQLKNRRAKEAEPQICKITWGDGSVLITSEGTAEDVIEAVDLCAKAILKWLEMGEMDAFTTAEVKEAMKAEKYSDRTVYRALGEILVPGGKVIKEKRGQYKRVSAEVPELPGQFDGSGSNNGETASSANLYRESTLGSFSGPKVSATSANTIKSGSSGSNSDAWEASPSLGSGICSICQAANRNAWHEVKDWGNGITICRVCASEAS